MVAKTNKRSVRVELSTIFGNLPDMLKQEVLEFAVAAKDPFCLSYSSKTKTFVKKVNPIYMKEMLEYKLQHPPIEREIGARIYAITITPPKISKYEVCISNDIQLGWTSMIFVNSKYMRLYTLLRNKYLKQNKKIMSMNVINDIPIVYGF